MKSSKKDVEDLMQLAKANKIVRDERFRDTDNSIADFEGTVRAIWKSLNDDGSGTVIYKTKEYRVVPQGTTSIPGGTKVNLSYRRGYYIAEWS